MLSIAIIIVIALTVGVTGYMVLPLILSIKISSPKTSLSTESSSTAISVLIPCHNEGKAVIELLKSLVHQQFSGTLSIYVLIASEADTSYSFLRSYAMKHGTHHNITIVCSGVAGKKEKLNAILPSLTTEYTFLIDADHLADNTVIAEALTYLHTHQVVAVQGMRRAKSVQGFFQLLDSVQNHVGNELLNHILRSAGVSAFFTGTTALFKTSILKNYGFSDSITEDTYLSYQLILDGHRIGYLSHVGSSESVSPRLVDYMARRRRWSTGHNRIAFRFFKDIFVSKNIQLKQKIAMFLHSLVFMVPVLSVIPFLLVYTFVFLQLPSLIQLITLFAALFISFFGSLSIERNLRLAGIGTFITLPISFPITTLLTTTVLHLQGSDVYYALISFPYVQEWLGIVFLITFLLPLLFAVRGNQYLQSFSKQQMIVIIATYPFIVLVDVYTFLLGFGDAILKRFVWKPISRIEAPSIPYRTILVSLLVIGGVVYGHTQHFFSTEICGTQAHPLLRQFSDTTLSVDVHRSVQEKDIRFDFNIKTQGDHEQVMLDIHGERTSHVLNQGEVIVSKVFPLGFEEYTYTVLIPETGCSVVDTVSTRYIETKEGSIYMNNEPFLVKGIVGSYSQRSVGLTHDEGMASIANLGANAIRIYHQPHSSFITALDNHHLFAMVQPSRSNWKSTDLWLRGSLGLLNRYNRLQETYQHHPQMLLMNLGNEIELHSADRINTIFQMLDTIDQRNYDQLASYATFYPSINYPSEVLGVNMLDTGETYWKKALDVLEQFDKPVVATELGGFEAFYEKTDPVLRAIRLKQQWEHILTRGFSGAFIFQSHDNWAQPVPQGYNNPFVAEQPDDTRGIFTRDNEPTSLAHIVTHIFSDITSSYMLSEQTLLVTLENIRPYTLYDVVLDNGVSLGDISPYSSKEITLTVSEYDTSALQIRYQTHGGIPGNQVILLPSTKQPFFPRREQFLPLSHNDRMIEIIPLEDSVDVMMPESWNISNYEIQSNSIVDVGPILQMELQEGSLPQGDDTGVYQLTFSSPESLEGKQLLLEGMGASQVQLYIGEHVLDVSVHPYREQLIDIRPYVSEEVYMIGMVVSREHTIYLPEALHPEGKTISIDMQLPRLFEPKVLRFVKK